MFPLVKLLAPSPEKDSFGFLVKLGPPSGEASFFFPNGLVGRLASRSLGLAGLLPNAMKSPGAVDGPTKKNI